ncbi:MAG: hypothetical protein KFH98_11400 [Gemmatimonadetes bacterium]|nr:hypothetical protein [Gemmatimonadota bacterium]
MTRTDRLLDPDGHDRWRHIARLFHVAMDMPERARMDFLDAEAWADADLRRELEVLLDADQAAQGRLDEVVTEAILSWLRSDRR